ncbi:MAG: hypothetical protein ACRD4O_00935, partial [Bryobacteraceae bacterium]
MVADLSPELAVKLSSCCKRQNHGNPGAAYCIAAFWFTGCCQDFYTAAEPISSYFRRNEQDNLLKRPGLTNSTKEISYEFKDEASSERHY